MMIHQLCVLIDKKKYRKALIPKTVTKVCQGNRNTEHILVFYVWKGRVSFLQFAHCETGKIPFISSPMGGFLDVVNIYVRSLREYLLEKVS